jgi:ABC-type nickel/cobalt efflux system permease component RcnA
VISPPAQGTVIRAGAVAVICLVLCLLPAAVTGAPDSPGEVRPAGPAASRGLLNRLLPGVAAAQRDLNRMLSRELRTLKATGSPMALATVALVAFGYGVLHAAGPGHGKIVVSSFFLARRARVATGILVGGIVSLLQVTSAIAAVLLLALVLDHVGLDVAREAAWIELASYGLIAAIGLHMTFTAIAGRGGRRHARERDPVDAGGAGAEPGGMSWSLVVATGLTPCASAIILLLVALANGVLVIGIIATLVMALGMGITMAAVGVATIVARRTLVGAAAFNSRLAGWTRRGLAVLGPLLITAGGCLFFLGAWTSLR